MNKDIALMIDDQELQNNVKEALVKKGHTTTIVAPTPGDLEKLASSEIHILILVPPSSAEGFAQFEMLLHIAANPKLWNLKIIFYVKSKEGEDQMSQLQTMSQKVVLLGVGTYGLLYDDQTFFIETLIQSLDEMSTSGMAAFGGPISEEKMKERLKGKNIILAGNSPYKKEVSDTLTQASAQVLTLETGADLLKMLEEKSSVPSDQIYIVCMSEKFSDMTGIECMEKMKNQKLPVSLYTLFFYTDEAQGKEAEKTEFVSAFNESILKATGIYRIIGIQSFSARVLK